MQDEEWFFYERFRAIERMGPRALFAFAALDVGGYLRPLAAIVDRARPAPVPWDWDDEAIARAADEIDAAEDAALTDLLTRGQWQLPAWFRTEALRVMLAIAGPPLTPLAHLSFRFWHAAGIFPEVQKKADTKKIVAAAFAKELEAFLDQTYTAHPFVGREIGRARGVYRNYRWAVRFQFGPESAEAIAKSDGVTRPAVDKVVQKQILPAVGLSPRTEEEKTRLPPGRKPDEA